VELQAAPLGEKYRFKAQVRQDESADGLMGIIFGHSQHPGPGGTHHRFCTVCFADLGNHDGTRHLTVRHNAPAAD
jgi:hypothetical protein